MTASPELSTVVRELMALPYASEIHVFGSYAGTKEKPVDIDVFIDLRGQSDQRIARYNELLHVGARHYGFLDPFLRTDAGLLVRNDTSTGWTRAKNATAIEAAMDAGGVLLARCSRPLHRADTRIVDATGVPLTVYHGTNEQFSTFDKDKTQDSLFWFTSDLAKLQAGESGAAGTRYIMAAHLAVTKPAGWDEYDRYTIDQLISMGFDGIQLDDDFVVFEPEQIQVLSVEPSKDAEAIGSRPTTR